MGNKSYLVYTTGDVAETKSQSFIVKAQSKYLAEQKAREVFGNSFVLLNDDIQVKVYGRKATEINSFYI